MKKKKKKKKKKKSCRKLKLISDEDYKNIHDGYQMGREGYVCYNGDKNLSDSCRIKYDKH